MNRRQYLASGLGAAGLLAGCLSTGDGGSTPTPRPVISIVDRDAPPDIPVEPSVEVATAAASGDGPPELRTSVENTADHPIEVGEERAIVFAFVSSEERPGLTLLPAGGEYPAVEPGCWRLREPIAIAEYYGVVELAPGEASSRRVGVWESPDGEGCLPTGEFRLATTYAGARDRTDGVEEREWQGTWGFTLAVE
ncbi:MAG: hypothetical protein U5J98_11100 [Halobacteriales archaeon]|nr:hypothetical protein [Halobacteriales archaeon]